MGKINASAYKTLDDIIFEDRNKSYGAYILRKIYDKHVLIALFIVAITFAGLIASVWVNELLKEETLVEAAKEEVPEDVFVDVELNNVPEKQELAIIQEPPNIKKFQFTEYKPVEDEQVKTPPVNNDDLLNKNLDTQSKDGKDSLTSQGGGQAVAQNPDDMGGGSNDGFADVVTNPAAPTVDLLKYVNSQLTDRTREYIGEKGVKGRLFVTVIINNDGSIGGATLLKDLPGCKLCNEEIPQILKDMPAWKPAENNGYKVKVRVNVPILIK